MKRWAFFMHVLSAAMIAFSNAFVTSRNPGRRLFSTAKSPISKKFHGWETRTRIRAFSDDDTSTDRDKYFSSPTSKQAVEGLFSAAVGRAMRTISTESRSKRQSDSKDVADLIDSASSRATSTLVEESRDEINARQTNDKYLQNPAVTPTALAHQLWSHVLRPNNDIVIDATCGNGNDSTVIASMLFDSNTARNDDSSTTRLVCIDIQQEACENTRRALSEMLDAKVYENNVQVVQASHESLRSYSTDNKVGLVCYNLGYLPNCDKSVMTRTDTTIASIADAALMLRVGGMISVLTYPKSNPDEDLAVHALLEGLALLTSKYTTWRNQQGPYLSNAPDSVMMAMERIENHGDTGQTWRVMEHKHIGRQLSPICLTATRIK